MKWTILLLLVTFSITLSAQPDTLWIPTKRTLVPYAVAYGPVSSEPASKRIGRFMIDTSRVAVEMDYKRGFPSGVYRAYYPDGRPLIFAIYGWKTLHGDWTEYGEDGTISLKGQYRQGKREGTWAFRQEGIVGHYKNGLKHGKWKYYEDGRPLRSEKYKKDQLKRQRNYNTR